MSERQGISYEDFEKDTVRLCCPMEDSGNPTLASSSPALGLTTPSLGLGNPASGFFYPMEGIFCPTLTIFRYTLTIRVASVDHFLVNFR